MAGSVVFVHGTGVREDGFRHSFDLIKRRVAELGTLTAEPCYWGGSAGAKLLADGASIPDYEASGGGEADEADEELARWTILYADPWYELRLIGDATFEQAELGFGARPPDEALDEQLRGYTPSAGFAKLLREAYLSAYWLKAHAALLASSAYRRAVASVGNDPRPHRKALARALIAKLLSLAADDHVPAVSGKLRDDLEKQLGSDLDAYGLGVAEWLRRPFVGLGKRWATRKLERERGAITDAALAMPADIILYQTRGQPIRDYIRQAVADAPGGDVTLLAHSLGGIAAVDLLIAERPPKVTGLITVGSQAPLMYELNCLSSLDYGDALPGNFPRWLNIYDSHDILSYVGAGVFGDRVKDVRVDNGQPFPESHSAYWSNPKVWQAIRDFLDG